MIQLETEPIVMSYLWHSQKQSNSDAIWLSWVAIDTKINKAKTRRRKQKSKLRLN